MIVVAVIGILAAVALPSFLDSIRKSHRADAFAALSAVSKGYYALSIGAVDATGYTAIATGADGTTQAGDGNCRRLRVRVDRGNIFYGSAASDGEFDESTGNRCWAR